MGRRFLLPFIIYHSAFIISASAQTRSAVMVTNATGKLAAPGNFFTANSNLLNAAVDTNDFYYSIEANFLSISGNAVSATTASAAATATTAAGPVAIQPTLQSGPLAFGLYQPGGLLWTLPQGTAPTVNSATGEIMAPAFGGTVGTSNLAGTLPYAQLSGLSGGGAGTVLSNTGSAMQWAASPTGGGGGYTGAFNSGQFNSSGGQTNLAAGAPVTNLQVRQLHQHGQFHQWRQRGASHRELFRRRFGPDGSQCLSPCERHGPGCADVERCGFRPK
jgi:hypothetical protein